MKFQRGLGYRLLNHDKCEQRPSADSRHQETPCGRACGSLSPFVNQSATFLKVSKAQTLILLPFSAHRKASYQKMSLTSGKKIRLFSGHWALHQPRLLVFIRTAQVHIWWFSLKFTSYSCLIGTYKLKPNYGVRWLTAVCKDISIVSPKGVDW